MIKVRLKKIKKSLRELNLDAILIMHPENRRYLTGFTGSAGIALITLSNSYLLTDFRYVEQAQKEAPDYQVIDPGSETYKKISELLEKDNVRELAFEEDYITFKKYKELKEKLPTYNLVPKTGLVENLRKIKDENELKLLKKAIEISDLAFEHILNYIKPGVMEKEIALELEYFMRKNGAEDIAFPTIVASGERSSLPHGIASTKKIAHGELVTMDFGAVFEGYNSDITRTVCVGKPTSDQKKIYNLVLKAQITAEEKMKAGITCKEADSIARDIIKEAGYGDHFGHGLGHGVGLAVHEGPTLSFKNDEFLKEGMTVTVEPGVYIPRWGGVRIEDIVLATENGVSILTNSNKELISL
jgi:Xaa-Pro aminopeptidase